MLKKIFINTILILPLLVSQGVAGFTTGISTRAEEDGRETLTATWKGEKFPGEITLASAEPESFDQYQQTLQALPLKEGYPSAERADTAFRLQNIDRQQAGNPFHLLKILFQEEGQPQPTLLGFVQLGRMPTLGYEEGIADNPTAHHPIIAKFISLGITHSSNGGLGKASVERISERGLAMILPLFQERAEEPHRRSAIEASYALVCELTKRQSRLPVENTLPHAVVSLFHPEDPNIRYFIDSGFEADGNHGFGYFYPKEGVPQRRVLVSRPVE